MKTFLLLHYPWLVAFHVIAVISWMAGMLYLPRLYAYHADAVKGSAQSETFKSMERRLLRGIINPAMIAAWLLGLSMVALNPDLMQQGWLHVKLACVIGLQICHALFARWRKVFARDENKRPARFYKYWNEVPAVLMVIIVIMVVVKPL